MDVKITRLNVYPVESDVSNVVGIAFVSFNDAIQIGRIRVCKAQDDTLYVLWPGRSYNDKFYPIAKPVSDEVRLFVQEAIVDEYKRVMAEKEEA